MFLTRRRRQTIYRKPRFQNRHQRKAGWLPPSLESRLTNVLTWVERLRRLCPLTALSMEVVKFDLHLMQSPEIQGMEYQQGTLAGYEVREYLLEKWERKCAYCNAENVPLQVEHIHPKANGGTNRVSNLCLPCEPSNQAKSNHPVRFFFPTKPELLKPI